MKKILLLGSGELGKEFVISAQRKGQYIIACDSYAGAPAMQVADECEVFSMLDGEALERVVRKHRPDIIVPEIEAIRTERLYDFEKEGIQVVPSARAVNFTMNRKAIRDLAAKELGLKYRQEPCNNVVIWKPASPGHESAEPIILQGHIDMVCAKTDDCTKDMTREGLDLMTDGEWIWADKTSLGGDNCIAVAMILAILSDDTLVHPPIEAVFTVDEEVGMDGAFALDCSDLKGKKLLNLDSELEGVFTVSCAGGMRSDCLLPAALTDAADMEGFGITVAGLQGGHSGADIHLGRGSGNRLMGRVLATALEKFPGLRLAAFSGGQFDNVICSRCDAAVALPTGSGAAFTAFIREFDAALKNEYAVTDPDVTLTCAAAETAKDVCYNNIKSLLGRGGDR